MAKFMALWQLEKLRLKKRPEVTGYPKRLMIVPCDPWTLTGSKGDEAMIQAMVDQLTAAEPTLTVAAITATPQASQAAENLGFKPIRAWDAGLSESIKAINDFKPDALVVLGADCMDGYYNPRTTARLLATADIMARQGVRVTISGFSFNDHPNPHLKSAFNRVSSAVSINVRDNTSFGRFKKFCKANGQLVADAAFMLKPCIDSPNVREASDWVQNRKHHGDAVLGFNIHPMLIKNADEAAVERINGAAISALQKFMQEQQVSITLISHDYRGQDGDDRCLLAVFNALKDQFPERLRYTTTQLTAAELKGIAGLMDGVVTGRMHLAIASLGMGTPVAVITYQDKFQGLMNHFEFPSSLLFSPGTFSDPNQLYVLINGFFHSLAKLKIDTEAQLPKIKQLSSLNVERLLRGSSH